MNNFLRLIVPPSCVACGSRLQETLFLCSRCSTELHLMGGEGRCSVCSAPVSRFMLACERCRRTSYGFDAHHAACAYTGVAAELMRAYKFRGRRAISSLLADIILTSLPQSWTDSVIVPVPSRRSSTLRRGFNPVRLLATTLSLRRRTPVVPLLVNRGTADQKALTYEERLTAAEGRFAVAPGEANLPEQVLLVDDVFTTGATHSACAAVLKRAGVLTVHSVSFAMEL